MENCQKDCDISGFIKRSRPWRMNASFFCALAIPLEARWLRLSCESMPEGI